MTATAAAPIFIAPDPEGRVGGIPRRQVAQSLMTVTPGMAKEWLSRNDGNRPLRYPLAAQLARDMREGKWDVNGETVKIADDGTLLDGQHRLTACIMAEVPFETFVVTGLPRDTQKTIDTGAKRRMGDVLALAGEQNANLLAALARSACVWDRGGRVRQRGSDGEPTHAEMGGYLDAHPELRDAVSFAMSARPKMRSVRPVVFGMAWLLFNRKSPEQAEWFLARLLDGADLSAGHPVHTLRAKIWRAKENDERLTEHEQLFLLVLAWNHYRAGNTAVSLYKLPAGGLTPKNFPEPK